MNKVGRPGVAHDVVASQEMDSSPQPTPSRALLLSVHGSRVPHPMEGDSRGGREVTDKLLEALGEMSDEAVAYYGVGPTADFVVKRVQEALPLARRLVEERDNQEDALLALNAKLDESEAENAELREENERLRPAVEAVNRQNEALQAEVARLKDDNPAWVSVKPLQDRVLDLQSRLSAAEERERSCAMALSAAEMGNRVADTRILGLQRQLGRAEEVIEAARETLETRVGYDVLSSAIRQYEEAG